MSASEIRGDASGAQRAALERSRRTWQAVPDEARIAPVVVACVDGARARIDAGPFTWHCDLPHSLGGANEAPSPTAALLGALAGCAVVLIRDVLAPLHGVRIDAMAAEVRCQADLRGLLALPGAVPDVQDLSIAIRIQSPDDRRSVESLYEAWLERCPVYLALTKPTAIRTTLEANG